MSGQPVEEPSRRVPVSVLLAISVVFGALIAVGTIFSIPLPYPLYEITWSPPIYMALAVLAGPWGGFWATAVGSFVGESYNIATRGGPPIFIAGIVWARAPEALIIAWVRKKSWRTIAVAMVIATVYETLAFFFPDWFFYIYGVFGYNALSGSNSLTPLEAFSCCAVFDFGTLVDLIYIPVAFGIIKAAQPAFKRLGFG